MSKHVLAVTLACAFCVGLCRAAVDAAGYQPQPFEHYQPILDRMPFGPLPANFGLAEQDPATAKSAAEMAADQQKLAKQINMSAINITPDKKTAVGFTDLSAKPPKNYFLVVGGAEDGWTLSSADYDEETAVIEKDGVSVTLKLGKGLVEKPPAVAPAVAPAIAAAAPPPAEPAAVAPPAPAVAPAPVPAPAAPAPAAGADTRSYRERLLERETRELQASRAAETKRQTQMLKKIVSEETKKQLDAWSASQVPQDPQAYAPPPEGLQQGIPPPVQDGNVQ